MKSEIKLTAEEWRFLPDNDAFGASLDEDGSANGRPEAPANDDPHCSGLATALNGLFNYMVSQDFYPVEIRAALHGVMSENLACGAMDTEPREVLEILLWKTFNPDGYQKMLEQERPVVTGPMNPEVRNAAMDAWHAAQT